MKNFRNLLFVLFSAVAAFGCTACSEKQGKEPVENTDPGRPADLLTLLYQSIEEQNRVNPRKHVYIVAHRANTLKAVQEYVPENSQGIHRSCQGCNISADYAPFCLFQPTLSACPRGRGF